MRATILMVLSLSILFMVERPAAGGLQEIYNDGYDPFSFEWLYGTWVMDSDTGSIVETWGGGIGAAGVFHGIRVTMRNRDSDTSKKSDTILTERMRIEFRHDTGMVFVANVPNEESEVVFKLLGESEPMRFVFENPTHEFPHRIIYQSKSDSLPHYLLVRIEGTVNGKEEGVDYAFERQWGLPDTTHSLPDTTHSPSLIPGRKDKP
jgi:hypothetical protein